MLVMRTGVYARVCLLGQVSKMILFVCVCVCVCVCVYLVVIYRA